MSRSTAQPEHPPKVTDLLIRQKCESMIKYGYVALRQFPKFERHVLAAELRTSMWALLRLIVVCNKRHHKKTTLQDNARTDAGDLPSDRAPMHQELTLTMPALSEAERSQMMQIMRANGIWKPIFISLLPRAGTAIEQDHMIYGKRKNTPMDLPYFATFAHSMEIESW